MKHPSHIPYLVLGLLVAAACGPLLPTPDDFPEPPMTPIVEFPTMLPSTPTPRPMTKPIFADDMADARTFFLILKVGMSAGDSTSFAERVSYPIQVRVNGQPTTILSAEEFESNYEGIFTDEFQRAIAAADEDDVELQLDGIKAAGGALWFNQFCADACLHGGRIPHHADQQLARLRMHSRRALLYVPGDDRHKIEKAASLAVDCICMDMEDGVAVSRKAQARAAIAKALDEVDFGQSERLARINAVGLGP